MRIGIDVRYLSHGLVGGVHNYVSHFVPELINLAWDHDIFLYADRKRPFELVSVTDRVTVRFLPWTSPLSSVINDFWMWRMMARDRLDVAHFPANYGFGPPGAHTIITLHDALNILPLRQSYRGLADGYARPSARIVAMTTYLHFCSLVAARRAALILTDSNHAAGEIARVGGIDRRRILAIPLGLAPDMGRVDAPALLSDARARLGINRSFILADALKNPDAVVQAYRLLPPELRQGRQIVFFARRPNTLPIIQEAVARGEAVVLPRPSREDLIALYSMAEAFVFPSWIEGFGIPVLEAMACGAPVVASDRGSIPEVAGNAALLADARDPAALAEHLITVLRNPDIAGQLRDRGFARAREFTWQKTAEGILHSYRIAMGEQVIPRTYPNGLCENKSDTMMS